MVRLKMAETVKEAVTFVEQGRTLLPSLPLPLGRPRSSRLTWLRTTSDAVDSADVRVGPEPVTDPAFLVTRPMEDFVTWVDTSKIRRKILKYNDKLDDYDLLA